MEKPALKLKFLAAAAFAKIREWKYKAGKLWRKTFGRVVDWPPSPGRFVMGNSQSAVAVCTLSSTALIDQLSPRWAAIIGRIYTPNVGVEKMITNVISNPRLRYLVLCGKESKIFKVGEALLQLEANGVDAAGKIIGATGPAAELTNLSAEEIEIFREQIKLIDHIGEMNSGRVDRVVEELAARRTSPYISKRALPKTSGLQGSGPVELEANRRVWLELDPAGYFIINLDRERKEILLEHFTPERKLTHLIRGRAADLIYHTVLQEKLLSQFNHAAYLGAELAKAETALYNNLNYEQDHKLIL